MLDQITPTPAENKQQELRMTIQRLRMKALMAAVPRTTIGGADDTEEEEEMEVAPPSTHPRLKRRLRYGDDMCDCESDVEPTVSGKGNGDEDEFTGPDGSFKLPRLMHPVLKRQHAVASIKQEHETTERVSPRLMLLTKPSRTLPCFLSRAIDLRFVQ